MKSIPDFTNGDIFLECVLEKREKTEFEAGKRRREC